MAYLLMTAGIMALGLFLASRLANACGFLVKGRALALAGVLACILIVTIPVGIASFRMARYVLWPFGKTVEPKPGAGAGSAIMNVLWFVIGGVWLAIGHLTTAAAQAITIVGIANAVPDSRMPRRFAAVSVALAPSSTRLTTTVPPPSPKCVVRSSSRLPAAPRPARC